MLRAGPPVIARLNSFCDKVILLGAVAHTGYACSFQDSPIFSLTGALLSVLPTFFNLAEFASPGSITGGLKWPHYSTHVRGTCLCVIACFEAHTLAIDVNKIGPSSPRNTTIIVGTLLGVLFLEDTSASTTKDDMLRVCDEACWNQNYST